jgi:nucleotide-binding universal stress UspA family protein
MEADMITVKNILVATDFSDASEAALAYARELAHVFASRLHVMHVVGNVLGGVSGGDAYATDYLALQRAVEESARTQMETILTDDDRTALSVKAVIVTSSSTARAIVSYAADERIDLTVVGTHGRGGMAHLLMGSVAERVVRTAHCPVLTVRGTRLETAWAQARELAVHQA